MIKDDATSANGAKFEIGSSSKLVNEAEGKGGSADEHGIVSGRSTMSTSVMNQSNNMDESDDYRPKILLMGLRRYCFHSKWLGDL